MASLEKSWEELNITRDEVKNIADALKNDEFRKLLVDYVEETQNPVNRKKYQDDIVQLEAERGVECTFVNPDPGFVIKTSIDGTKKAFINICSNGLIGKPECKPMATETSRGLSWSIPYSQAPGRDDYDKKNNRCIVYDVVFHPDTLHLAQNNVQFKNLVIDTALKGVQDSYKVKLDQRNIKLPKLKYKGVPNPTVIRRKSINPVQLTEDEIEFHKKFEYPSPVPQASKKTPVTLVDQEKEVAKYTTPHYIIKHRSDVDIQDHTLDRSSKMHAAIPKQLIVEINLPLLSSTKDVTLDISEKSLELICEKPAKYKLSLTLPYAVSQNGSAKFNAEKRILEVILPVLRSQKPNEYIREDSGVESDQGETAQENSEPEQPQKPESFLDSSLHYLLPSFDYSRENNSICFILNVKNVDPTSIKTKVLDGQGCHVKFTSVGSGYFPIHYGFCAVFDFALTEGVGVEAWDNNVTVQVHLASLSPQDTIRVGLDEASLEVKRVDEILDLTSAVEELSLEQQEEEEEEQRVNPIQVLSANDDEVVFEVDMRRETSPEEASEESSLEPVPKLRTYSEGSGDEMNGGTRRSILKTRMSRSLSESCADDVGSGFTGGVLYTWSDSCISERGEGDGEGNQTKKTVRFSQNIQRQTFRANSSILGQRRKNQKRTRNKKKAMERRLSESENSEEGDEREKWTKRRNENKKLEPTIQSVIKEEAAEGKISAEQKPGKKRANKSKTIQIQSQFINELDE